MTNGETDSPTDCSGVFGIRGEVGRPLVVLTVEDHFCVVS